MANNRITVRGIVGRIESHGEGDQEFHSLSVNVSDYIGKDKETNENRYESTWFNVSVFGGLSKRLASASVNKGDRVEFEGKMTMRENEKDGRKYQNWGIVANDFEVIQRKAGE